MFEPWLRQQLAALDADADALVPYVASVLEDDPDALEGDLGDQALLKQKYDAARGGGADDDVGDVLADGVRNMKRKLDKASSSAAKKQKDFKF